MSSASWHGSWTVHRVKHLHLGPSHESWLCWVIAKYLPLSRKAMGAWIPFSYPTSSRLRCQILGCGHFSWHCEHLQVPRRCDLLRSPQLESPVLGCEGEWAVRDFPIWGPGEGDRQ